MRTARRTRSRTWMVGALLAALAAVAGLALAQGIGIDAADRARFVEVGAFGDGSLLLQEETADGVPRLVVGRDVQIGEEPVVVQREVVGTLPDGRILVEERVLRAVEAEDAAGLRGLGVFGGVSGAVDAQTGVTEVGGAETLAGAEPGPGEFEPGDQEPPASEVVAP